MTSRTRPAADRRSASKRAAILAAATETFLATGFLGTNMDEIASQSGVSKQTVYKHFESKEALFIEVVSRMTNDAGDTVYAEQPLAPETAADVAPFLRAYAERQLSIVLTPRLMQLRRLVIGEVSRFPALAAVLYDRGPARAIATLTGAFAKLQQRGLLRCDDPRAAASQFNWLIMAEPLNDAMLLGDAHLPGGERLRRHVEDGVRVFLSAYGLH